MTDLAKVVLLFSGLFCMLSPFCPIFLVTQLDPGDVKAAHILGGAVCLKCVLPSELRRNPCCHTHMAGVGPFVYPMVDAHGIPCGIPVGPCIYPGIFRD